MSSLPADATAYAGVDAGICEDESYTLMGVATNYSSVLWTTSGFGTFDDPNLLNATYTPGFGELGDVTLTLTAYGIPPAANASDNMVLTIHDGPEGDFTMLPGDTASINQTVTFSGTATTVIISWDWDFGDGNTGTGQVVDHAYTTSGTYAIRLIIYNINSCSDTCIYTLVVVDQIIDFIMSPSPSCEDYVVFYSGLGGVGGWDYLWDFGDGDTAIGQNVTHAYDNAGTYLITLTYGIEVMQHSLLVNPISFANAGVDDDICGSDPYTLSGFATNYSSLMWTSSGDGTFNDPTIIAPDYTPGPGDNTAGAVTLTFVAYGIMPCYGDTAYVTLSIIQAGPITDAGADTASCDGIPITLDGFATNQSSNLWSTAGDGTFDNSSLLNATYTPGTNDLSNGSVLLTLTSYAVLPCTIDAIDDILLSFPIQATVDAGEDDMVCENSSYTLSGSATNYDSVLWTSSGDGSFDDPALLNATYIPGAADITNGTVTLTLTAEAMEPCIDAVDDMILNIQQQPFANAGDDVGICEGEICTLAGSASNQSNISWDTDGDGGFNDPAILNPTYTPGPGDISNGGALLSLTAYAFAPCSTNMLDAIILSIDPMVGTPVTPYGPTMVDTYLTPTSEYVTEPTSAVDEYIWTLSPVSAGDIIGNNVKGEVSWDAAYQGFAYIKVIASNSCAAIASDSLQVEVTTSVGFEELDHKQLFVSVSPNPCNGIFRLIIKGVEHRIELSILNSHANLIEHIIVEPATNYEHSFNLSYLPKGIYILKLQSKSLIHVEKIIIR